MEKVQRRLVRALSDVRGESYEEKLKKVGLTTLKERRKRGDAIETFKTLKGFNRVEKEEWFQLISEEARPTRSNTEATEDGMRRKENVIKVETARLEVRRNWFMVRAAKIWNELPEEVKKSASINAFKTAYDRWVESGEN